MSQALDLSVVVPVYRSATILPRLHAEICEALKDYKFEIVLVHDASPDNSWDVIVGLARKDPRVRGVNLRRNSGQHNAIMAGLYCARGAVIVTMDDDMQHSPSDIPLLYAKVQEGADVCYAQFGAKHHEVWKKLGSAMNDRLASYLLSKPRRLYLSPFRAFSAALRQEIVKYCGPSVYLDGLILRITSRIATVTVAHHRRADGTGNYSLRKSISLLLRMATMTSVAPLRVATATGFVVGFVGIVVALGLVIARLLGDDVPVGWTSLLVVVLLLSSVQLIAIGMVGEYLGKVTLEVRRTPQFTVAETVNLEPAEDAEGGQTSVVQRFERRTGQIDE